MNSKVEHWIRLADEDVITAKAMLKTKRYLWVGFLCHLIVEKALKAMYSQRTNDIPPKIHNLLKLAELAGLVNDLTDTQRDLLNRLKNLYIDGRYEEYKEAIRKTLTPKICKTLITEVEDFLCMIKTKLEK